MYEGGDNDSDSEDDAGQLRDKRKKREEVAAENVKYNARNAVFDHALRLSGVRTLCLRGLDASQTQRVRQQYKSFGRFRVEYAAGSFTVWAEDRAPEPLDLKAIAEENFQRATQCRAAVLADAGNNFWPRRTVEQWTIEPDLGLHIEEALLLRDFPVMTKVWSPQCEACARNLPKLRATWEVWSPQCEACARNLPKPRTTFFYTSGDLPQLTKKAARALYTEVLNALKAKYPHWRATGLGGSPLWTHKVL